MLRLWGKEVHKMHTTAKISFSRVFCSSEFPEDFHLSTRLKRGLELRRVVYMLLF